MLSRKTITVILACFVVVLFGYYYLTEKFQKAGELAVPAYMEETASAEWVLYKPENGHFQVRFPVEPKHISEIKPFNNEQIIYNIYLAHGNDGTSYMLSCAAYPTSFNTSNPKELFEKLLQDMTKARLANEIISQTDGSFDGSPSLDFDLQNRQYATLGRAILAGKTLYVLTVMDPDRSKLEQHFHTFTNSFKVNQ